MNLLEIGRNVKINPEFISETLLEYTMIWPETIKPIDQKYDNRIVDDAYVKIIMNNGKIYYAYFNHMELFEYYLHNKDYNLAVYASHEFAYAHSGKAPIYMLADNIGTCYRYNAPEGKDAIPENPSDFIIKWDDKI